jgi:hypothetical protein
MTHGGTHIAWVMSLPQEQKACIWIHIGFTLDSHWIHIGFILDSHWIHIEFTLDSYWIHIGFTLLFANKQLRSIKN